jgi:predicted ArsR family transcriptional regulator
MSNWTLFSNHGHVLVCLARDSGARLRDVAAAVGITERAVQKIVRDLQQGDMIEVSKKGRRNQYRIHTKAGMRHELEAGSTVGGLIEFVNAKHEASTSVKRLVVEKQQVTHKTEQPRTSHNPDKKRAEPTQPARIETVEKSTKPAHNEVIEASTELAPPPSTKPAADVQQEVSQSGKPENKDKSTKAAKAKSEIEKQQGSLF